MTGKEEVCYVKYKMSASLCFSLCLINAPALAPGSPAGLLPGLQGFSVHSCSVLRVWAPVLPVRGAHSY